MKQYVFGYGSLINTASRLRTVPSATEVIPVTVSHMSRGWWLNSTRRTRPITYLSVVVSEDAADMCNGVMFEVNEEELAALDYREQGYDRVSFSLRDITYLLEGDRIPEDATLWTYVVQEAKGKHMPSEEYPLLYSYVDICLIGCLQMERLGAASGVMQNFTQEFIEQTLDWKPYWGNDREEEDFERLGDDKTHIDSVIASIKATYGGN